MRRCALAMMVLWGVGCESPALSVDDGLVPDASVVGGAGGLGGSGGTGGGATGGAGGSGGAGGAGGLGGAGGTGGGLAGGAGGSGGAGGTGGAGGSGGTGGGNASLPSCLGTAAPLLLHGQTPYTTVKVGPSPGVAGSFLVDFGSTGSWIDPPAFTPTPTAQSCSSSSCTYAQLDFFGPWGTVTLSTADFSWLGLSPPQAGIVGTDFLSVFPVTVDYAGRQLLAAQGTFCTDTQLTQAGFIKLSTSGFYASNVSQLVPMATVLDGGVGHVPNVPTVPVRVAGVTALAQLDTGFDDTLVPHSLNINVAYFDALTLAAPQALVRDAAHDLSLSTCVGLSENVQAYRLATGFTLELLSTTGTAARSDPAAVLFVKRTPAAARVCGGIGTWTVPAAQLAGSAFVAAGALVCDPIRSVVWLKGP